MLEIWKALLQTITSPSGQLSNEEVRAPIVHGEVSDSHSREGHLSRLPVNVDTLASSGAEEKKDTQV